jgi:hypothetical protein
MMHGLTSIKNEKVVFHFMLSVLISSYFRFRLQVLTQCNVNESSGLMGSYAVMTRKQRRFERLVLSSIEPIYHRDGKIRCVLFVGKYFYCRTVHVVTLVI